MRNGRNGRNRLRLAAPAALVVALAACASREGLSPALAQRAHYAPSGRVFLAFSAEGAIEEAAVPASPNDVPAPTRTAIERERPGGIVQSVHRVEGARGVTWRIAKVVLGESVVYEAREDGEILSRAVAVEPGGPAWATAAAASEAIDPGGEIVAMSYVSGPSGKELVVRKTRAGVVVRLTLRARSDGGFEKTDERREVDATLGIASAGD